MMLRLPDGSLQTLASDQWVSLGVGEASARRWYRGQVLAHDDATGRLVLTCFLDRPTDEPLAPGQRVVISAAHGDDDFYQAPMDVEDSSAGAMPTVMLRLAGVWHLDDERRVQVRLQVARPVKRARRWYRGAWHDVNAQVVDMSSRGIGLLVDQEVSLSERFGLVFGLEPSDPDIHVNAEIRHVRPERNAPGWWRAGAAFRTVAPADHERIIRFIFAEIRSR